MHGIETENRRQIEELNQRGGRTLSLADLLRAGTLSPEAAAWLARRLARGASLLTAARQGGAGKTALLAALLGLLPEGEAIVTVERMPAPAAPAEEAAPRCYLVHEIGAGHWHGYLWGPAAASYLSLARGAHRIASCLHADTREELYDQLARAPLGVPRDSLLAVDLLLFIRVAGALARDREHRVTAIYAADPEAGEHRLVFRWDRARDRLLAAEARAEEKGPDPLVDFFEGAARAGPYEWEAFRRGWLATAPNPAEPG